MVGPPREGGRYHATIYKNASMLFQVVSFVLDIAVGLLAGACLFRLYMQALRTGFSNQIGQFLFAATDWIVLPLRRILPAVGRIDSSSLLAAYLLVLLKVVLLLGIFAGTPDWAYAALWALVALMRLILSALSALVLVCAILSWMQAPHVVKAVLDRLSDPLLKPLRRWIPPVGGLDLTPLLLLVLLQIASMLLGGALPMALR